jgi:NADH:ubiquinone reductase (non-electrogenic)
MHPPRSSDGVTAGADVEQVTQLTREHSTEVADIFDPAKAAGKPLPSPSSSSSSNSTAGFASYPNIYALGDCCANTDNPLPPLAQVAEQQGRYLASILNEEARNLNPSGTVPAAGSGSSTSKQQLQPFTYHHLGSMATVGGTNAILQLGGGSDSSFKVGPKRFNIAGFLSW